MACFRSVFHNSKHLLLSIAVQNICSKCTVYAALEFPNLVTPQQNYNSTLIRDPTSIIKLKPWYDLERTLMNFVQPVPFRIEQFIDVYNGRFKVDQLGNSNLVGIFILVLFGIFYSAGLLMSCLLFTCRQRTNNNKWVRQKYDPDGHMKTQLMLISLSFVFCFCMAGSCVLLVMSLLDFRLVWKYSNKVVQPAIADNKAFLQSAYQQIFADKQTCLGNFDILQNKIRTELTGHGSVTDDNRGMFQGSEYSDLRSSIDRFEVKTTFLIELINSLPDQMLSLNKSLVDLDLPLSLGPFIDRNIKDNGCILQFPCWAMYGSFRSILHNEIVENLFIVYPGWVAAVRAAYDNISSTFDPYQGLARSTRELLRSQKSATDMLMLKLQHLRNSIQYTLDPLHLDAIVGLHDKTEEWRFRFNKMYAYPLDSYLTYIMIGVLVWIITFILLVALGVLWGVLTFEPDRLPDQRHGSTNCGGLFLTYALLLVRFFSWIITLATIVLMVAATQLEKAGCFALKNEAANFSDLRTAISAINRSLTPMELKYNNKTLDIASTLSTCLVNGPAWTALNFSMVANGSAGEQLLELLNISGAVAEFHIDYSQISTFDPKILPFIRDMLDAVKSTYDAQYVRDTYDKFQYWYHTADNSRPLDSSNPVLPAKTGQGLLGFIMPIEDSPVEAYNYSYRIWNENYFDHAAKYLLPYKPYTVYYNLRSNQGPTMNYSQRFPFNENDQESLNSYYTLFDSLDDPNAAYPGANGVLLIQKNKTRDILLSIEPALNDWVAEADAVTVTAGIFRTAVQTGKGKVNVEEFAKRSTDQLLGYVLDYVTFLERCVVQDSGQCRPVYDAYHAVVHLICDALLPPVNLWWFLVGLILLIQGPTIITISKLKMLYSKGGELFPHKESISWSGSQEGSNEHPEESKVTFRPEKIVSLLSPQTLLTL